DQRRIDLRLADLDDVQRHFAVGQLGEIAPQLLDVGALLADYDAGTGAVDRHARLLRRTLDDDSADARLSQSLAQEIADLDVLVQQAGIVLAGEPARVPGPVDAQTQADRIDFLTHYLASASSCFSRTTMVRWLKGLM